MAVHRGYESVVNRWNFVKGLDGIHDEKELLASFSKYRRKNIRIAPGFRSARAPDWNAAN